MARKPACDRRGAQPAQSTKKEKSVSPVLGESEQELTAEIPASLQALPIYKIFAEIAALDDEAKAIAMMGLASLPTAERETIPGLANCFLAVDAQHHHQNAVAEGIVENGHAKPLSGWWFSDKSKDVNQPSQLSSPLVYMDIGQDRVSGEPAAIFSSLTVIMGDKRLLAEFHFFTLEGLKDNLGMAQSVLDERTLSRGVFELELATKKGQLPISRLQ